MKSQWKKNILLLVSTFLSISCILSFYKTDEEDDQMVRTEAWNHGILLGKWGEDLGVLHHRYHEVRVSSATADGRLNGLTLFEGLETAADITQSTLEWRSM